MWFNQVPRFAIAGYKKAWFTSTNFRRAISASINREDLARVVFRGHARPAVSWISPATSFGSMPGWRRIPLIREPRCAAGAGWVPFAEWHAARS